MHLILCACNFTGKEVPYFISRKQSVYDNACCNPVRLLHFDLVSSQPFGNQGQRSLHSPRKTM